MILEMSVLFIQSIIQTNPLQEMSLSPLHPCVPTKQECGEKTDSSAVEVV